MTRRSKSLRPIADIFHALGNEARVRIVLELSRSRERCVCELVECCELGWSTVSHHLSVLREAGVVEDEKRGQKIFYRLAKPCVAQFILCLENPKAEVVWPREWECAANRQLSLTGKR